MISLPVIPSWVDGAACAGTDPETWQPTQGETDKTRMAKRICAGCPSRMACLEDALKNNERFGIWGGLTVTERDALTSQKPKPEPVEHGNLAGYKRHITQHTEPCESCKAANAEYQRDRRRERALSKALVPPPRAVRRQAVTA